MYIAVRKVFLKNSMCKFVVSINQYASLLIDDHFALMSIFIGYNGCGPKGCGFGVVKFCRPLLKSLPMPQKVASQGA